MCLSNTYFAQRNFLNEHCIALLDNAQIPFTFYWIRLEDINLHDIYVCKITKKIPQSCGYFAKIDHDRPLFVETKKTLQIGQKLGVVITKEARLDKVPQAKCYPVKNTDTIGLVKKGDFLPSTDESQPLKEVPWDESFDDILLESEESIVMISNGGRIIFEPTRAVYSIDVDSAASTVDIPLLNQDAAKRIGQEIIKRNISGNIVIDFIGHKDRKQMTALGNILSSELNKSPIPYKIFGLSQMGNMEIRRERARMDLKMAAHTISARCYELFRQVLKESRQIENLRVSLEMYAALTGLLKNAFEQAIQKKGYSIPLIADTSIINFMLEIKS